MLALTVTVLLPPAATATAYAACPTRLRLSCAYQAEIKAFIESVYGMQVERVNTINYQGKKKRDIDGQGTPHYYRWARSTAVPRSGSGGACTLARRARVQRTVSRRCSMGWLGAVGSNRVSDCVSGWRATVAASRMAPVGLCAVCCAWRRRQMPALATTITTSGRAPPQAARHCQLLCVRLTKRPQHPAAHPHHIPPPPPAHTA